MFRFHRTRSTRVGDALKGPAVQTLRRVAALSDTRISPAKIVPTSGATAPDALRQVHRVAVLSGPDQSGLSCTLEVSILSGLSAALSGHRDHWLGHARGKRRGSFPVWEH